MKRKLDTGHYTSSSAGEDDFSSLRGLIWTIKALSLGGTVHVMNMPSNPRLSPELRVYLMSMTLGESHLLS